MRKGGKILVLIGGILELISSLVIGLLWAIIRESAYDAPDATAITVLAFLAAILSILIFMVSVIIFNEKGNIKGWAITLLVIGAIGVVLSLADGVIAFSSALLTIGAILILVDNKEE